MNTPSGAGTNATSPRSPSKAPGNPLASHGLGPASGTWYSARSPPGLLPSSPEPASATDHRLGYDLDLPTEIEQPGHNHHSRHRARCRTTPRVGLRRPGRRGRCPGRVAAAWCGRWCRNSARRVVVAMATASMTGSLRVKSPAISTTLATGRAGGGGGDRAYCLRAGRRAYRSRHRRELAGRCRRPRALSARASSSGLQGRG